MWKTTEENERYANCTFPIQKGWSMQIHSEPRTKFSILLTAAVILCGCNGSVNELYSEISDQKNRGVISTLPNGKYLLQTFKESANASNPFSIVEFKIPSDVRIQKTQQFENRTTLERYLLEQYVSPLNSESPTLNECNATSGVGGGGTDSGPPRIFIILPTSAPAFTPIAIGGTNFNEGAIPYINGVPSIALFNFSLRNIPLIGCISVGFTIVPPEAPPGTLTAEIQYFGQLSNPFPFTKN